MENKETKKLRKQDLRVSSMTGDEPWIVSKELVTTGTVKILVRAKCRALQVLNAETKEVIFKDSTGKNGYVTEDKDANFLRIVAKDFGVGMNEVYL
jgi:hypothetical protein